MNGISHFAEGFEAAARKAVPYSLIGLLLVLDAVPLPFLALGSIKAPFFLMGLYYWSVYRPTLIPPWLAFAAGLAADAIGGLPLGMSAALFVLARWMVVDQRRFLMGQSFIMLWLGFLFLNFFIMMLEWMILGCLGYGWAALRPLMFSVLLGQALFPLTCVFLYWTHRFLPSSGARA